MNTDFPRHNNLEWLRLIFASQVLLVHAAGYMNHKIPEIVKYFPGVPAFFFVSGFLIYASYNHASGLQFFRNRFLRVFPGLVFVTMGGVGVVLVSGGLSILEDNPSTFALWCFAQVTLGQAYNPWLFRNVGVGVINGALWTITTEIIFYILVPIIVWFEKKNRWTVHIYLFISLMVYIFGPMVLTDKVYRDKTMYDILALTPIVWGWMFCCGILILKYFFRIQPLIKWMWLAVFPMALMIIWGGNNALSWSFGNRLGILYFIMYIFLIIYFAFNSKYLALPFDLSYGVYLWHMPVINFLHVINQNSFWLTISFTFSIAMVSWFLVEQPMLKLKRHSLRLV